MLFHGVSRHRIVCSFAMYASLLAIGMMSAEIGPSITIFSESMDVPEGTVSGAFSARFFGYFVGSLIGGPVIDLVYREGLVIGPMLILSSVLNFALPYVKSVYLFLGLMGVQGLAFGAYDATMAVMFTNLHGKAMPPWMEAIHFSYALGTLLAPLIMAGTFKLSIDLMPSYSIFGALGVAGGLYMALVPSFKREKMVKEKNAEESINAVEEEKVETKEEKKPLDRPVIFWSIVVCCSVFLCAYVTLEVYGGLIALYTEYKEYGDVIVASYMTSVFYASFTVGRCVAIPAAVFLSPEAILFICAAGCVSEMVLFLAFPSKIITWIISATFGVFMGPIWATTYNYLGQYITFTGKAGTAIVVGTGIGSMTIPTLIGNLMTRERPWVLPLQQVISTSLVLAIFTGMFFAIRHLAKRELARKARKQQEDIEERPLLSEVEQS